jgi:glycosyltransferase involved in cell wall biosynthesis
VGCAEDLVMQGINGFVVPKGDLEQLQNALEQVYTSLEVDDRMRKASRSRIEEYSIGKTLQGFLKALEKV